MEYEERSSTGYWATAVIVVVAIAVAVWWYTGTNPAVPNTGDTGVLQYNVDTVSQ